MTSLVIFCITLLLILYKARENIISILVKMYLGYLTSDQIAALKDWLPVNVEVSEEKKLVPEGRNEMFLLAQRMQKRFSNLLPDKFDSNIIKVITRL